ncbi:TPA: bifunctional folylpolyglutamate synthase/dihydrofolate synthase [Candidatus Bipolaricaulota bacterium]|nr:bifunctional folylpolyglutamate synthase/dihydrofolate synthase [Candidatus Bipolaricaulota bacterium]
MDYTGAKAYLKELPYREVKPGLERVSHLLERLGNPHASLVTVHVGGTNGKGSVVAMLSSVLEEAGLRVGTYTSPHLLDWPERIRINGEWIPEEEFARLLSRLKPLIAEMSDKPTVFETLTALAFQYFHEQKVDLAVIEVGLGGRFDATNVIKPLVAVITHVERDHLDLLGPTLEHAAWEISGLVKPGVPLVTGERKPKILEVLAWECKAQGQGAELLQVEAEPELVDFSWERQVFWVDDWGEIELDLLGPYQGENLAVALKAIEVLRRSLSLPDETVRRGLARARWPGRFQIYQERPYIILDGAHNPSGIRALRWGLELYHERYLKGHTKRILLFGAMRDKELDGMSEALFPWFDELIFTKPDYYRAVAPEALLERASRFGKPAKVSTSAEEAFRRARAELAEEDLLCVAGSLYLIGEILGAEGWSSGSGADTNRRWRS